jgi:uncharacterized protein YndB with AHSA1/START domain
VKAPDVAVSVTIARTPAEVWEAVADPVRMATWSPENTGARVPSSGPLHVGATFSGSNRNGVFGWSTVCVVVESTPAEAYSFEVSFRGMAVARWRYSLTEVDGGCLLEEQWWDRRGPLMKSISVVGTGVVDRASHNEATMRATLEALRSELDPA